jgi:hypothetical protein
MNKNKQEQLANEFQELCNEFITRQDKLIRKYKLTHSEEISALLTTQCLILQTIFQEDTLTALEDIKIQTEKNIKEHGTIRKFLTHIENG